MNATATVITMLSAMPKVSDRAALIKAHEAAPRIPRPTKPSAITLLGNGIVRIAVSRGLFTLIEEADLADVAQFRWFASPYDCGFRVLRRPAPNKPEFLSRRILRAIAGQIVDHINGDTLDNRRSNLRFVDARQSVCNRSAKANSTSRYVGVAVVRSGKFQVMRDGLYFGQYASEEVAARVADDVGKSLFGDYVRLNFPTLESDA